MGGASSRRKGANAEREFFGIINKLLGRAVFRRNVLQSAIGGQDSMSADSPWKRLPAAIEVKRCETLSLPAWVAQAKEQAVPGQVPVLAYRRSQEPWTVAVLMTPEQFAEYYKTLEPSNGL